MGFCIGFANLQTWKSSAKLTASPEFKAYFAMLFNIDILPEVRYSSLEYSTAWHVCLSLSLAVTSTFIQNGYTGTNEIWWK